MDLQILENQFGQMGLGCVGSANCANIPIFKLSCPHQKHKFCIQCFPFSFKNMKCGCEDEEISSIQIPAVAPPAQQAFE